jgi:hypothetical protein
MTEKLKPVMRAERVGQRDTPVYPPKQIEGLRAASRRAHPVLAVSGMGCAFCGSSRSRMAFNAWV